MERFELFLYHKLRLSADEVTKSSNGTCTVWKTPSVTFRQLLRVPEHKLRKKKNKQKTENKTTPNKD